MSVEHRPPDHPADAPRVRTQPTDDDGRPLDSTPDRRPWRPSARSPLADRIERAHLRARIAALERSLDESERRRQAVVDQYELALEAGDDPPAETDASDDGLTARVRRLCSTLGR